MVYMRKLYSEILDGALTPCYLLKLRRFEFRYAVLEDELEFVVRFDHVLFDGRPLDEKEREALNYDKVYQLIAKKHCASGNAGYSSF